MGRDKWRRAYVKAYEQVGICRAFQNIPGNRNRFESLSSPGVSTPHITAVQRSNNLNMFTAIHRFSIKCLLSFDHDELLYIPVIYIYDIPLNNLCHVT